MISAFREFVQHFLKPTIPVSRESSKKPPTWKRGLALSAWRGREVGGHQHVAGIVTNRIQINLRKYSFNLSIL